MVMCKAAPAVLVFVALGSAACANETGLGAGAAGDSGGSGGAVVTGGSGGGSGSSVGSGGEASCPKGPGYDPVGAPQLITQLTARLFDQSGAPAPNVPVLVCGFGACSKPGRTSTQGEVCTLDKDTGVCSPGLFPGLEITRPAFKYGLGIEFVKFAQPLPSTNTTYAVGDVTTVRLPDMSQGVELIPGASATSSGVTLTLAAGTTMEFDLLAFETPEQLRFRAAEVPLAKAPPAVDESIGFEIVVGTTPVDTRFCPHAALSVPNTAGWPPGTEVEFWVHGVSLDEEWAPYGGWGKVSDGTVSADGGRVVTSDAAGVPILGVFGIKKR